WEPLQLVLTRDFVAVFAEKDADGTFLWSHPIDALAVCRVIETVWWGDTKVSRTVRREVGALSLQEGVWHVEQESDNFAGLCRVGDDIRQATGELDYSRYPLPEDWKEIRVHQHMT